MRPEKGDVSHAACAVAYGPFIGSTLVTTFAVGWVAAGVRSLLARWPTTLSLLALAISAIAVWRECGLLRQGVHVPKRFDAAAYGAAVAFESIAIPLAAALLKRHGKAAYLLPAIALIVGVHFFWMVWAFDSPACGWIGGAMCVLPIATVTCLPAVTRRGIDGHETKLWDEVVGFGRAVILWIAVFTQF